MKVKAGGRFYIFLLILSCLIALISAYLIWSHITPYQIETLEAIKLNKEDFVIYHDFDKDGFSESIRSRNIEDDKVFYLRIEDYAGGVLDQCNFLEPVYLNTTRNWLTFGDCNEDGIDEIFTFTQSNDSLFLYIHDLHSKKEILKRCFLLKAIPPYLYNNRPFHVIPGGLIELDSRGNKGLVFAVNSGYSLQPRGVYIFDINKSEIINRFQSYAFVGNLILFDLTGDGKDEIILTSNAFGNVHFQAKYKDDRCWLFVFNHNLTPVFEPLSFGEFSSYLTPYPFVKNREKLILLSYQYNGTKHLPDYFCFVTSNGLLSPRRKQFYSKKQLINLNVIDHTKPSIIFYATEDELLKTNEQLTILKRKTVPAKSFTILSMVNINGDDLEELMCFSGGNLLFYDQNLNFLAKVPVPYSKPLFTFRNTGLNRPVEIGYSLKGQFYRFGIKKNHLYSFLPLIVLTIFVTVFLIFFGIHTFSSFIFTQIKFFRFLRNKSSSGIIILNRQGQVMYINQNAISSLGLTSPVSGKVYFNELFHEKPQITAAIRNSFIFNQPVREKFFFVDSNFHFEGEINVTPNISPFKFFKSFIVEIRDNTQSNLAEKLQIWSNTVQKMVHDIKTPLSSMTLSLKALQMRLQDIQFDEKEPVNQNIEMVRSELNRVYDMTKDFLNFAKLEKPNFQVIEPRGIIEHAISMFQSFPIDKIEIQTEFNAEYNKIWADSQQIELVLHILIENSIDALDGKGLIRISTSLAQYLRKHFMGFLEFEVADSGPGMEANVQDKIFKPYFTTKENGTGMGLAIAKKIIEEHGGTIGLYSKEGFGTVIRFSLPLYVEDKKVTQ